MSTSKNYLNAVREVDLPDVEPVDAPPPEEKQAKGNRVATRSRGIEAVKLRAAGLSLAAIADRLDTTTGQVALLIDRALERTERREVDKYRDIENMRLDTAQAAIWRRVLQGEDKAVDTFLRISARRAKMNGLDVPATVHITTSTRVEMETALAQLSEIVMGEVIEPGDTDTDTDTDTDGAEA